MNCNSANIIYLVNCTKCNKLYVGETKRQLKDRLNNHRSDIKLFKNTTIAIHFNDTNHTVNNLKITPIEQLHTEDTRLRLQREKYWIKTLHTQYPEGLNYLLIERYGVEYPPDHINITFLYY